MKAQILIFVIFLSGLSASSQIDTASLSKNIRTDEDSVLAIFQRKDWNSYARYMNPAIMNLMGGKDAFVQTLSEQMKALDSAKVVLEPGTVLQVVKSKDQYQCIFESFMQLEMSGMKVAGSSFDIGMSADGKDWTFFRITEAATRDQIKEMLPDLSPDLKLPRSQMLPNKTIAEFKAGYSVQYLD